MTHQLEAPDTPGDETQLYVYAIVPEGPYQPAVTGIDGAQLSTVDSPSGVRAVVHAHTTGPFEGPDEDVKRWILQHSDVVDDAWAQAGAVLPVSFNVIARPDLEAGASAAHQLALWLTSSGEQLRDRLDELRGTAELRVEISLDRSKHVEGEPEVNKLTAEMADRPAGVRRLLEKRLEKVQKELTENAADRLYPDLRSRIAAHCLKIEEYRKALREPDLVPVLVAACLVETAGTQDLGAELSAIHAEHPATSIRFLGPWPPYSFADMTANEEAIRPSPTQSAESGDI